MTPDRLKEIEEEIKEYFRHVQCPLAIGELIAALREAWGAMKSVENSIELQILNPKVTGFNEDGLRMLSDILKVGRGA